MSDNQLLILFFALFAIEASSKAYKAWKCLEDERALINAIFVVIFVINVVIRL